MSKKVYCDARIVFGGADISEYVTRWAVEGRLGELYVAELDILDSPDAIVIVPGDRVSSREFLPDVESDHAVYEEGQGRKSGGVKQRVNSAHSLRVPYNDKILIQGTDVSRWISGYDRMTKVGYADTIRLYVQCDSDSLSINGTTPWEVSA